MSAALRSRIKSGRHDAAERRQSLRKGRERGCSVYVSGEELANAGIDPHSAPPQYRIWPGRKGTLLVQLYAVKS